MVCLSLKLPAGTVPWSCVTALPPTGPAPYVHVVNVRVALRFRASGAGMKLMDQPLVHYISTRRCIRMNYLLILIVKTHFNNNKAVEVQISSFAN